MKSFEKGRWQKGKLLREAHRKTTTAKHRTDCGSPYTSHIAHTYPRTHPLGQSAGLSLPRLDLRGWAMDRRRERGSHATGAGTGAPPGGIYSRPALKGRERGHACFPFHSQGTFTRPHMWVLNIYPNTGSNIVGAEKREAVCSPFPKRGGLAVERRG